MKAILTEMLWLDEHTSITFSELAELSGLSDHDLEVLIDYGVIAPVEQHAGQSTFHARCVLTAKTAHRLRDDFELDAHGMAVAVTFIERVQELEAQLHELHAIYPHTRSPKTPHAK